MSYDPLDPQGDPFGPPEISVEVGCLHCQETYDSYLIEWRIETDAEGKQHGFWCCPTPGCSGRGFGFDILPTDPNYRDERGGWVQCDDEEFDEDNADEDSSTEGLPGGSEPGGNGRSRTELDNSEDDQIPF